MNLFACYRYFLVALFLVVFTAPALAQDNEEYTETTPQLEASDMLSTLKAEGEFTVLLDALRKSGVEKTLGKEGPFTLFAPTDEAFAKLPDGTLDQLSIEELTALLERHIVLHEMTSEQALSLGAAQSINGDAVEIKKSEDGVLMVNNATLVRADVVAGNGVMHVIDTVLGTSSDDTLGKASEPGSLEGNWGARK